MREKLPKVAAKGSFGPPPLPLAACVVAPLEDNHTLQAAKVCSRLRNGSSVGDALTRKSLLFPKENPGGSPSSSQEPLSTPNKIFEPIKHIGFIVDAWNFPSWKSWAMQSLPNVNLLKWLLPCLQFMVSPTASFLISDYVLYSFGCSYLHQLCRFFY